MPGRTQENAVDLRREMPRWPVFVLMTALGLGLLWYFQVTLGDWLSGARPVPISEPVLLYTWTDSNGTVHFSQDGEGHRHVIVARADHITRLEPLSESHRQMLLPAIGGKSPAAGQADAGETGELHARMTDKVVNDDN